MIEIKLTDGKESMLLELKGHANYDVIGKDIVCAAVSAIAQSLAMALANQKLKGRDIGYEHSYNAGHLIIKTCDIKEADKELIKSLYYMAYDYLIEISLSYPKNVSIID